MQNPLDKRLVLGILYHMLAAFGFIIEAIVASIDLNAIALHNINQAQEAILKASTKHRQLMQQHGYDFSKLHKD